MKHTKSKEVYKCRIFRVTEDEAVARRWLTSLTREPLCDTSALDPSRDYYVRIRARMRDRTSWLGWAHTITGQVRFSFIP